MYIVSAYRLGEQLSSDSLSLYERRRRWADYYKTTANLSTDARVSFANPRRVQGGTWTRESSETKSSKMKNNRMSYGYIREDCVCVMHIIKRVSTAKFGLRKNFMYKYNRIEPNIYNGMRGCKCVLMKVWDW